ncbi:hypothetical protein GTY54_19660 [Streptomyces sp. SID625]|nr:hypothetical protein [Streptomyces sp. SID625]
MPHTASRRGARLITDEDRAGFLLCERPGGAIAGHISIDRTASRALARS